MKIAHIITRIGGGGTEKNLLSSLKAERERGHDCTVIYGSGSFKAVAEFSEFATLILLPSLRRDIAPIHDIKALAELRVVAKSFDVLHTHHSKAGVLGRSSAVFRSQQVVIHTVHMASFGSGYSRFQSATYSMVERLSARRTDYLCFVGHELKEVYFHAGIVPRYETRILRSAIDIERFINTRMAREQSPKNDTTIARPYLLAVGALELRKRYDLMIQCLEKVLTEKDLKLKIAGAGAEHDNIRCLLNSLGLNSRVELLGHIPNVDEYLANASALVHTSAAEGVPQVVMQALIAGVPVIATEVEGLAEIEPSPILIARRDGNNLADMVHTALKRPPVAASLDCFDPWRPVNVKLAYLSFLEDVEALVKARSNHDRNLR